MKHGSVNHRPAIVSDLVRVCGLDQLRVEFAHVDAAKEGEGGGIGLGGGVHAGMLRCGADWRNPSKGGWIALHTPTSDAVRLSKKAKPQNER